MWPRLFMYYISRCIICRPMGSKNVGGWNPPQCSGSVAIWYRILVASYSFRQWPSKCQQIFFYLCLFIYKGTFTSFFENKVTKKSSFFYLIMEGSRSVQINYGSGSRRLKTYGPGSGSGTLLNRVHKFHIYNYNVIIWFYLMREH